MLFKKKHLCAAILSVLSASVAAQTETNETKNEQMLEEMVVLSKKTSFANNNTAETMIDQQSTMTSVLAVVDNLPGVLISEGDAFGGDDWSTTISIRGFQVSLDEQQIGMTVDGIPNGGSNYGGGAKANRFIDTENLGTVEVSQGTADIASRSHEALGGTLNFISNDPQDDERMRFSISQGDHQGQKLFVRYDTGTFANGTKAYISLSSADGKSWIDESGESTRDHLALKVINSGEKLTVTGYLSYDDTEEDNYQRVSLAEFEQNPEWDRLTGEWTGIPMIDQSYRRGWSTLRENTLGYVKLDWDLDSVQINTTAYYHHNTGRGDWVPQYIADVTDDGAGNPESELTSGNTVYGGASLGSYTYVSREGMQLTPGTDCASLSFPYGGTSNDDPSTADVDESSGLAQDPACFPADAVPVGSYRHTHYGMDRYGLTADGSWTHSLAGGENTLRGGIWYEDRNREEFRNWHKVLDSRVGYHYDATPYWVQYDREYPTDTFMYYIEDSFTAGIATVRLGGKQWFVETTRNDNFGGADATVNSDSDLLPHAGVQLQLTDNLEAFSGYAENYAAIKDAVLETNQDSDSIRAETAENFDIGLRYTSSRFDATITLYSTDFKDRLTYIPAGGVDGVDYLGELDGVYTNVGGIESSGAEVSATIYVNDNVKVYSSYTYNDATYKDGFVFGSAVIPEGNTVFGSAEEMFVLSLDWQKGNYGGGFSNKYVGARWMDPQNTQRIDAYNVADIYAAVTADLGGDVFKGMEIRMVVNNLFDEQYIGGVAGGWGGWIGADRTASVNLTLDF